MEFRDDRFGGIAAMRRALERIDRVGWLRQDDHVATACR
jgi:hypothetical protein